MPFAVGTVRDMPVRAMKLCGLTWTGQFLWFSEAMRNSIVAVDPYTERVEHRVPCPAVRSDLTTLGGYLVQVAGEQRRLRMIDPQDGDVLGELPNPRPGNRLTGLEATRHGIWLGYEDLKCIDLRTAGSLELIDTFPVREGVAGLTVSDSYLVYADFRGGMINRGGTLNVVDIGENREIASYLVAGNPTGITWDGSRIWYCDHSTFQLRAVEIPGLSRD